MPILRGFYDSSARNCTKNFAPDLTSGGAKCIGQYGGYETFIDKLTEVHANESLIQYYIVTKAKSYMKMMQEHYMIRF